MPTFNKTPNIKKYGAPETRKDAIKRLKLVTDLNAKIKQLEEDKAKIPKNQFKFQFYSKKKDTTLSPKEYNSSIKYLNYEINRSEMKLSNLKENSEKYSDEIREYKNYLEQLINKKREIIQTQSLN